MLVMESLALVAFGGILVTRSKPFPSVAFADFPAAATSKTGKFALG
jgi:hypothetical protein